MTKIVFCIIFILVKIELKSRSVGFIMKHSCSVGINFYSILLNCLEEGVFKETALKSNPEKYCLNKVIVLGYISLNIFNFASANICDMIKFWISRVLNFKFTLSKKCREKIKEQRQEVCQVNGRIRTWVLYLRNLTLKRCYKGNLRK